MSKNSKSKRDKKKSSAQSTKAKPVDFNNPESIKRAIERLFSPSKLSTPSAINADLLRFAQEKISDAKPFFINSEPELWSRQSCCDRNVMEYIKLHGGEMVCGYRLWYHPPYYIEGERHAVWRKDGVYKDVSFSSDGEKQCLFVPDTTARQSSLGANQLRIRWGKNTETRELIEIMEGFEKSHRTETLDDETAWNTMLTYERWLAGERMSNMLIKEN